MTTPMKPKAGGLMKDKIPWTRGQCATQREHNQKCPSAYDRPIINHCWVYELAVKGEECKFGMIYLTSCSSHFARRSPNIWQISEWSQCFISWRRVKKLIFSIITWCLLYKKSERKFTNWNKDLVIHMMHKILIGVKCIW